MESPNRVLLGSQSEEFGLFPSMSTSSTPIRVDTKEVGRIHLLLPTLEYSTLVSSPVIPSLTPIDMTSLVTHIARYVGVMENAEVTFLPETEAYRYEVGLEHFVQGHMM